MMSVRRQMILPGEAIAKVEAGEFTPTEDVIASETFINHSLGTVPDFICVIAVTDFEAITESPYTYIANGVVYKCHAFGSNKSQTTKFAGHYVRTIAKSTVVNYINEFLTVIKFANDKTFRVPHYNSDNRLKANVTYRYLIGKFKE